MESLFLEKRMRSRLSIFSSRLFSSALIWAVLAAVLIEWRARHALPEQYSNHEVDSMLYYLDEGQFPEGDTVFLGDSVGRQVARALLQENPDSMVPLASNGSIETIGQYYVLRRYLEHYPAPDRLILMMFNPVEGILDGKYTENYFQRGFLRWREILEVAWYRHSVPFTLTMVGYKLSPVFRHRIALQSSIPMLETRSKWSGSFVTDEVIGLPPEVPKHGLLDLFSSWLNRLWTGPPIAHIYFRRMAALLEDRGIEWYFLAPPLPESSDIGQPNGAFGRQIRQLVEWKPQYPSLHLHPTFQIYPDDWFPDGTHLAEKRLPDLNTDYSEILRSIGFEESVP
jgi:hypothetical protein